jgi:hypothetical protein
MEASVSSPAVGLNLAAQRNAAGMKGWIRFMGIVQIVAGAMTALSIVGIIWAWLPIWVGIVLVQAGSRAGDYAARGDDQSLEAMTGKLKSYFVISGVVMIVSLVMTVIGCVVWAILLGAGLFSTSDIMNRLGR